MNWFLISPFVFQVTCVHCGKLLAECPICRSNIVRVVRVFKSWSVLCFLPFETTSLFCSFFYTCAIVHENKEMYTCHIVNLERDQCVRHTWPLLTNDIFIHWSVEPLHRRRDSHLFASDTFIHCMTLGYIFSFSSRRVRIFSTVHRCLSEGHSSSTNLVKYVRRRLIFLSIDRDRLPTWMIELDDARVRRTRKEVSRIVVFVPVDHSVGWERERDGSSHSVIRTTKNSC